MVIKSMRTGRSYENAQVYEKENKVTGQPDYILRHAFLQTVYDEIASSDKVHFNPVRRPFEQGSPTIAAYSFYDDENGIFAVGEVTWEEYNKSRDDSVLRRNPDAYAVNRCFDKWSIRYMKFAVDGEDAMRFYSDAEISLSGAVLLTGRNISADMETAKQNVKKQELSAGNYDPGQDKHAPANQQPTRAEQSTAGNQMSSNMNGAKGHGDPAMGNSSIPVMGLPVPNNIPLPNTSAIASGQVPPYSQTVQTAGGFVNPLLRNNPNMGSVNPQDPVRQNPMGNRMQSAVPDPGQAPAARAGQMQASPRQSTKIQPKVLRVEFNFETGLTMVTTDHGTIQFNPVLNSWIAGTLSPAFVQDINQVYREASASVGMPLETFGGIPSFDVA